MFLFIITKHNCDTFYQPPIVQKLVRLNPIENRLHQLRSAKATGIKKSFSPDIQTEKVGPAEDVVTANKHPNVCDEQILNGIKQHTLKVTAQPGNP